jgi:hypothetical protein
MFPVQDLEEMEMDPGAAPANYSADHRAMVPHPSLWGFNPE